MTFVPILIYHSVADRPIAPIAPFAVAGEDFAAHLDLIIERGLTALTVTAYLSALRRGDHALLGRAVLITFDDGFADVLEVAAPALAARGLPATLYVTTGFLRGGRRAPVAPVLAHAMLAWSDLPALTALDVELGAHSHSHPHLDTLGPTRALHELQLSKDLLEEATGQEAATFAYPHGYSSPALRRLVRRCGFRGACGVGETFSGPRDDPWALSRLMLRDTTTRAQVAEWLDHRGAPPPRRREQPRTRAWRAYRRGRAVLTRRPGGDPGWT